MQGRSMVERTKKGKQASVDGFAHEHIALGILMKKYQNVSLVDLPHSRYDIVIIRTDENGNEDIIRAQVKTVTKSISFKGGGRAGVDRKYISRVKEYVQNPKLSDVIIGVSPKDRQKFDLYFVPTILVETLKTKSISVKKAKPFRNNYTFLERCKKRKFVIDKATKYGLLKV
jgi:hypothetical protein